LLIPVITGKLNQMLFVCTVGQPILCSKVCPMDGECLRHCP